MVNTSTKTWFETRTKCPACDSSNFKSIYQSQYDSSPIKEYLIDFYTSQGKVEFEYLEGANYILYECDKCNLIFQKDIPNDELMERLYEHWIDPKIIFDQHQKKDGLEYYAYYAQEIMQIIAYLGKKPSSLSFFDFGMGWAKWLLMVKAFGCDSYGTELSQERIDYAKSVGINVITWEDIPQNQFDFINTEQVFEHIPNPLQTLIHLKKALKPEGLIKISVPTANNIDHLIRIMDWKAPKGTKNSLNPVAPLEHINYFRRSSIIQMAEEAGMKEVLIPQTLQYRYTTDWGGLKKMAKNIIRPIYRNLLKKQNCIFLRSE